MNQIGQVLQIERGEIPGPVRRAQCSEGAALLVRMGKPGALREETSLADPRRQRRILSLEKPDHGVNRIAIRLFQRQHLLGFARQVSWHGTDPVEHARQTVAGEQRKDHLNPDIGLNHHTRPPRPRRDGGLARGIAMPLEKAGQVRGGGIGRVELGQRRDQQEETRGAHDAALVSRRRSTAVNNSSRSLGVRCRHFPTGRSPRRMCMIRVRTSVTTRYPCAERSEEHTSELQSLAYLVCRLLLEKKKKEYRYIA